MATVNTVKLLCVQTDVFYLDLQQNRWVIRIFFKGSFLINLQSFYSKNLLFIPKVLGGDCEELDVYLFPRAMSQVNAIDFGPCLHGPKRSVDQIPCYLQRCKFDTPLFAAGSLIWRDAPAEKYTDEMFC